MRGIVDRADLTGNHSSHPRTCAPRKSHLVLLRIHLTAPLLDLIQARDTSMQAIDRCRRLRLRALARGLGTKECWTWELQSS